jgi:hypothetical protein
MSTLMLDVGQANEFKLALRREGGWTNEEVKMLCERQGLLRQVREVLIGRAEIKVREYVVDLDATPYTPQGWSVEEHQKGGVIKWDATMVALHFDGSQKNGGMIEGGKLRRTLTKLSPYNANMLDFLIREENQHLIPEEWKVKDIYFWGTIYRGSDGELLVRCLCWDVGLWGWDCRGLCRLCGSNHPALVPAS